MYVLKLSKIVPFLHLNSNYSIVFSIDFFDCTCHIIITDVKGKLPCKQSTSVFFTLSYVQSKLYILHYLKRKCSLIVGIEWEGGNKVWSSIFIQVNGKKEWSQFLCFVFSIGCKTCISVEEISRKLENLALLSFFLFSLPVNLHFHHRLCFMVITCWVHKGRKKAQKV